MVNHRDTLLESLPAISVSKGIILEKIDDSHPKTAFQKHCIVFRSVSANPRSIFFNLPHDCGWIGIHQKVHLHDAITTTVDGFTGYMIPECYIGAKLFTFLFCVFPDLARMSDDQKPIPGTNLDTILPDLRENLDTVGHVDITGRVDYTYSWLRKLPSVSSKYDSHHRHDAPLQLPPVPLPRAASASSSQRRERSEGVPNLSQGSNHQQQQQQPTTPGNHAAFVAAMNGAVAAAEAAAASSSLDRATLEATINKLQAVLGQK